MRIIYILSSTTPYGGASKSFLNLLEIMIQKGIIPLVIVPDNKSLCAQLDKLGVAYRTLFYRFCVYPPTRTFKDWALFLPRLLASLCSLVRRADVVSEQRAHLIPLTLLATIEIPIPVVQMTIPLSHSPLATASAAALPNSG